MRIISPQTKGGAVLLLALVSCSSRPDPPDAPSYDCRIPDEPSSIFGDITLHQSEEIPTVFELTWSPVLSGSSQVQLDVGDGELLTFPTTSTTDGGLLSLLAGLKPSTTYEAQIILEAEDETFCSDPLDIETGTLPTYLPAFEFEELQPDQAAGGFTLIPLLQSAPPTYQIILDRDGEVVWYSEYDAIRMRLSIDGQAILINDRITDPDRKGSILRLPLNGSEPSIIEVLGIHLDFVEVEHGRYASFGWDIRKVEGREHAMAGETIVEFTEDGEVHEVWNIFDYFDPSLIEGDNQIPLNCCPDIMMWAHLNHLHYAPEEDAYYVSSRLLMAIFKIDRSSGELIWVLPNFSSQIESSFALMEGSSSVSFTPHSAVPTKNGVLIFDTASQLTNDCSAISEFELDEFNWEINHLGVYTTEDCQVSSMMGNAEALWNDNRLLILSLNGQIDEVTEEGELVARWRAPQGTWLGFTTRVEALHSDSSTHPMNTDAR